MALWPAEDAWRSLFYSYVEPAPPTPTGGLIEEAPAPAQAPPPQRPFLFFRAKDQRAASALAHRPVPRASAVFTMAESSVG